MKKYAQGGTPRNRPIDAVNIEALPDTAPPKGKSAPKKAMPKAEAEARIRRAQGGDRMEMNRQYSGEIQRKAKGGVVRGDGMCTKGHTKGRMV